MTPSQSEGPPKGSGPLARREARLAWTMLAPTFLIVFAVVALPLVANFWISVKPVELADLNPPQPVISERVKAGAVEAGDSFEIVYTIRNTSPRLPVRDVLLEDAIPDSVRLVLPSTIRDGGYCAVESGAFRCAFDMLEPRARLRMRPEAVAKTDIDDAEELLEATKPRITGVGENPLTSLDFTWENFRRVFSATEFWDVLWTSIVYTVFGTGGALILGLFAALLLNRAFRGRAFLRGLFLFPYVAPVIAVAYTWVTLLDPNSGALNAILLQLGVSEGPVNFLGQRTAGSVDLFGWRIDFPLALTTVIVFEAWRYFPLSFLFILARMQSIDSDMYEAAEMDGATPLQQFWYLSLPQLATILAILFLLRFIWTFNKFDDIFLLTGGASGTRTLTVNVYEQAIALSNIGAGAAVAVVVFAVLLVSSLILFRFSPRED